MLKLNAAVLLVLAVLAAPFAMAEDAKPDAPAATPAADAPKADAPKPADTASGELPKPPEGTSPLSALHQDDSLVGTLSKGEKGKGKKKKDKAGDSVSLKVDKEKKVKGEKTDKKGPIILTATGDVLAKLNSLAESHAHVKVTGALSGDTMTVKEVTEVTAEKKKKKNGV